MVNDYYLSVVGITMIHPTALIAMKTNLKISSLYIACLPLSLLLALTACDSSSSNNDNNEVIAAQTVTSTENDTVTTASEANIDQDSNEGTSLIAAAKSDNSSSSNESGNTSPSSDSILQATLIGDYYGMMPCSFCDSTEVVLNLYSDGSMLKTSTYENPKTIRAPLVENGIYRQDDDMITIAYANDKVENYLIQNNHLVLMSDNALNTDYTLSRQ